MPECAIVSITPLRANINNITGGRSIITEAVAVIPVLDIPEAVICCITVGSVLKFSLYTKLLLCIFHADWKANIITAEKAGF